MIRFLKANCPRPCIFLQSRGRFFLFFHAVTFQADILYGLLQ